MMEEGLSEGADPASGKVPLPSLSALMALRSRAIVIGMLTIKLKTVIATLMFHCVSYLSNSLLIYLSQGQHPCEGQWD